MTEASKHGGMADSGLLIDMRNVVKTYNEGEPSELTVLHGVDFYADQGEFVSIVGPSGCGKSTVLRSLNRMHEVIPGAYVKGEILLDGTNIYGPKVDPVSVRNTIGMVFQKANPFPTMSIEDNVVAGLRLSGEKNKKKLKAVSYTHLTLPTIYSV